MPGLNIFRPFTSRLNRDMRNPNLKFIDLDGDGHADVLITEDNAFVWHPSLAEAGSAKHAALFKRLMKRKVPVWSSPMALNRSMSRTSVAMVSRILCAY